MLDIIVCITQAISDFPDVETMVLRIAKGYPWCYVVLVASTRLERRFADGSRAPKPKVVLTPGSNADLECQEIGATQGDAYEHRRSKPPQATHPT
jgi:hypothetical protein